MNFVPAERTRGGFKYEVMEIPTPRGVSYVSYGVILVPNKGWLPVKWFSDGRRFMNTESDYDLIPSVRHRYARVYRDNQRASNWFDSLEAANSLSSAYHYYIIHEITYRDGKVELEALDREYLEEEFDCE